MKDFRETVENYAKIEREHLEALRHLRDIEMKYCEARANLEIDAIVLYGVYLPDGYEADDVMNIIEESKNR